MMGVFSLHRQEKFQNQNNSHSDNESVDFEKAMVSSEYVRIKKKKKIRGTCADFAKYYNSCKCCISGDIGIDKSKAHSKQLEGNCADKNVVISNKQMQLICDIPVLHGKWNSQANFIHTSHVTSNNPFLSFWYCKSSNQRTVYILVSPPR